MRIQTTLVTVFSALVLTACQTTTTYKPEYVHTTAPPPVAVAEGKALMYMDEADATYVFNEGASTFTGSGAKMSVPLGLMTREIGKTIYGRAFREGVDFANVPTHDGRYRVVIQPKVTDFKYYFHQAENLGFAVTPGAELTLTVTLLDAGGKLLAANTYVSGERKGGSYMMSASPEDKISKLVHGILADLMAQSVPDIQRWVAKRAE